MKRILIFIYLFVFAGAAFAAGVWYKPGDTLYVTAQSGLNLRDKADIGGKLIIKVPYGSEIKVLKDTKPPVPFAFDNIKGHWAYIEYKGKKGYIFDGYLSTLTPPELTVDFSSLLDYLMSYYDYPDPKETVVGGEGQETHHSEYRFTNNICANISVTDYWTGDPSFEYSVYTLPGFTRIEEVFVLLKNLGYFKNDPDMPFPVTGSSAGENKVSLDITCSSDSLCFACEEYRINIIMNSNGIVVETFQY
ncbi:MAG: hypothetical protein A2Y33_08235 [Spirochaetes bacterium GWF1_51_8]|nr:MAG: hypothetical protein A2Y33_08235 [Spirochaetes bacterium GWF1_51_8]